ncbi:MAG: IS1 family transposase ISLysp1 [Chroococcidiopsis sp. SAG 2025]|uniref:IS1 family transposase n=1 Tax=Chroococcidiopsis sp. SAG 2025 TaxID=171389 RepID=UPI002936DA79|nr:IS1 family transposase [Chroococcidiopsis sp. SAG 2025]MDV2996856.1 IS1 family transposase ISLysp1 [Chroococcidiopsis sp. SAG 2025]
MSDSRPTCPRCYSHHIVKNGRIHNKKPKFQCQDCQRQFVENPTNKVIDQETKELIDRLLLEKIPLASIARTTQVSETWLQNYVNDKYVHVPRQVSVSDKPKGKLTVECDEAWSFVDRKGNQQWIWLAMDRNTREIVGVYIGDRSKQGAIELWNSLPTVYRQCAICYTDFWISYENVIPKKCHRTVRKESGKTNHIERFNNTMRQRISRLVRATLSFSKKLENHIGAIWYFIHYYNACLQL